MDRLYAYFKSREKTKEEILTIRIMKVSRGNNEAVKIFHQIGISYYDKLIQRNLVGNDLTLFFSNNNRDLKKIRTILNQK